MIFRVTMHDPDTLYDAIQDAVADLPLGNLDNAEAELVRDKRAEKVGELCSRKWFEYGEYLTVEIDTEAKTCVVVPNKE
jgi:hypothetical protein